MCFDQSTGKSLYDFIFNPLSGNGTDRNRNNSTNDPSSSKWRSGGFFTTGNGGRCFIPGLSAEAL